MNLAKPPVRNKHIWGWSIVAWKHVHLQKNIQIFHRLLKCINKKSDNIQVWDSSMSQVSTAFGEVPYIMPKKKCLIILWTLPCSTSYLLSICFDLFFNCFLVKLFINSLPSSYSYHFAWKMVIFYHGIGIIFQHAVQNPTQI